jgi:hypothetical protein
MAAICGLTWKRGLALMAAICGLTTQCPGAVKMLEAAAALARTDESVKKYGSCNCRALANIVARRRANA